MNAVKNICRLVAFSVIHLTCAYSQSTLLRYSIAPWQNDKKAAVSITLDDCMPSQFQKALPILNRADKKIPSTFFITSERMASLKTEVVNAYNTGHEIANHTITHAILTDLTEAQIKSELEGCQLALKDLFKKEVSFTHAYPSGMGAGTDVKEQAVRNICKKYFIAARGTQIGASRFNPYYWETPFTEDSYFKVTSKMIADGFTASDFATTLENAMRVNGWFAPTYHGIDEGWVITSQANFTSHMDEIVKRQTSLWIATFHDVAAYHKERACHKLAIISEDNEKLILQLTDTLSANQIFNVPLTVKFKSNNTWTPTSINQGGKIIDFTMKADSMIFNATPDGGNIEIYKNVITSNNTLINSEHFLNLYPNPAKTQLHIPSHISGANTYEIISEDGRIIQTGGSEKIIPIEALTSGTYLIRIRSVSGEYFSRFVRE